MKFPLGEMSAGDILDRGIKLLFARLPTFYLINLIVLSPAILAQVAAPLVVQNDGNPGDPATVFAALGFLCFAVLLTVLLYPLGSAAVLHIIMEEYVGNKASIGQAVSFALTRFFPLAGASILVGLLVMIGCILCCIPGIYIGITYLFVSQVVVLERLGANRALERSSRLINGHRWRVFGVLALIYFANWIVQFTIGMGLGFAMPSQEKVPAANGFRVQVNAVNHIVTTLIAQLVSIVFTTYIVVCTTLLYLDIRIRKEGFDIELASGGDYVHPEEDDRDRRRERDRDFDRDSDPVAPGEPDQ